MNFVKLSIYYQYIYSPKSWLHKNNNKYKVFCVFLQLLTLPYCSLTHILYLTILAIVILIFTKIPTQEHKFLQFSIPCFGFIYLFLKLLHLRKDNNIYIKLFLYFKSIYTILVSISIPLQKLISICIAYLFIIKINLLTVQYEETIYLLFSNLILKNKKIYLYIYFMIIICSQFIQIILIEADKKRLAYLIRGIKSINARPIIQMVIICPLLTKVWIHNIYLYIYYINYALYSRNINLSQIYFFNIYKK